MIDDTPIKYKHTGRKTEALKTAQRLMRRNTEELRMQMRRIECANCRAMMNPHIKLMEEEIQILELMAREEEDA